MENYAPGLFVPSSCDPAFVPLIRTKLESLESTEDTVYGIWPDGRIAYLNPTWYETANERGEGLDAWQLGRSIHEASAPVLRAFYEHLFQEVLGSNRERAFNYQNPTPTTQQWVRMTVQPLGDGAGLLISNRPLLTAPYTENGRRGVVECYQSQSGRIHQCPHCRRTKRGESSRWDLVPSWIASPLSGTLYDLCPICCAHFYKGVLHVRGPDALATPPVVSA